MAVLDAISACQAKVYTVPGPASYATGGFLMDASADFSWIGFVDVNTTTRGVLPSEEFEILLNKNLSSADAMGKAVVKIVIGRYDKADMGNVSGNPAGTTVRSVKFAAATTVGSAHTHTIDHNHPAVTSANETASGTLGLNLAAGGPDMRNHNHDFDISAFAGSSGSTTHNHDRSFEYGHTHALTIGGSNLTEVELANGTDISGTTFTIVVFGFGKS